MKHTPGPWKTCPNMLNGKKTIVQGKDGVYKICAISGKEFQSVEVAEANARLIAASPEMLEALQKVKKDAQRQYDEARDRVTQINAKHFIVLVESAITKATGEKESA